MHTSNYKNIETIVHNIIDNDFNNVYNDNENNSLIELYNNAVNAYELSAEPIMLDSQFDIIKKYLVDNKLIEFSAGVESSFLDNVHLEKKPQVYSMLSIETKQVADFGNDCDFEDYLISRYGKNASYYYSLKYDGAAIQIVVKDSKIQYAITRGDRTQGLDVSKPLQHILEWHQANNDLSNIKAIIGEAIISKNNFAEHFAHRYKNARNAVSGLLNANKDPNAHELFKYIEFEPFKIVYDDDTVMPISNFDYYAANQMICKSSAKLTKLFRGIMSCRHTLKYNIDGIVVIPIGTNYAEINKGVYSNYLALKDVPVVAETTIKAIDFRLRNNGKLFPRLILEPVELDGSTVRHASAFNYARILNDGLFPGAKILIGKSGDIIPDVQEVIEPVYESQQFRTEYNIDAHEFNGVDLISSADTSLKRFISGIHMLNLNNVGTSTAIDLFNSGYNKITDLFNYKETALYDLYKKDSISLNNITNEITKRFTKIHIHQLVKAMRFDGIGEQSSKTISEYIVNKSTKLNNVYESRLVDSEEFEQFVSFIQQFLDRIDFAFYWHKQQLDTSKILEKICLTGSPKEFGFKTKAEFISKLKTIVPNWEFQETDVKNCQYLITDDVNSNSNKTKIAKANLKHIVTYDDYLAKFSELN
jgi:NAD-dependent DNA ligase